MWGTDRDLIDADEYCPGCEHSTVAQDDGSRHYQGCPEQAEMRAAYAEARRSAAALEPAPVELDAGDLTERWYA